LLFFILFKSHATTYIYTLSLHDALPILSDRRLEAAGVERFRSDLDQLGRRDASAHRRDESDLIAVPDGRVPFCEGPVQGGPDERSEEHTSELQSRENLVCRLLLEKKKKK